MVAVSSLYDKTSFYAQLGMELWLCGVRGEPRTYAIATIYALFCINRTSRSRRFSEADDAVLILTNSCCTVGRAVSEHQIFSMPSVLCNPLPSDWGKYQLIP